MSSTLSGLDLNPLPPVESKDKKSPNRANAFSRCEDRADDPAPATGSGDHAYADDSESQLSKPTCKLEEQKDPLREALQREATELFEAGDYDAAGEKFYYLAEAAHHASDRAQEATSMLNMGTSLMMLGTMLEASRCYARALELSSDAGEASLQRDALESLAYAYAKMDRPTNAVECLQWLRSLLEETEEHAALCNCLLSTGALYANEQEWGPAAECMRAALDRAGTLRRPRRPGRPRNRHRRIGTPHCALRRGRGRLAAPPERSGLGLQ